MVIVGLGLGNANLIGHNLGANKKDRAWKTSYQAIALAAGIMVFFGAITALFTKTIVHFFFQDPEIVSLGITLLRIQAIAFPLWGILIMIEDIFTGSGDTLPPTIIGIITAWVLEIPAILFMTRVLGMDQNGVWWAIVISTFISTVVMWKWYRLGKWMQKKV